MKTTKDRLKWCLKQGRGLELIEPNSDLAESFLEKAEIALEEIHNAKSREWKISAAYYAMFNAAYAILLRIGVKCELHICVIEFLQRLLQDYFSEEEGELFERALEARKDTQYYTNRDVPDPVFEELTQRAPTFLIKCKSVVSKLTEKEIKEIKKTMRHHTLKGVVWGGARFWDDQSA